MATPTFTLLNHQALSSADANTGWNDLTTADADIKVEGSASMSGIFRADGEQGYYDAGSAPVTAVGKTVRGWIFTNNIAYMGTEASDGYKLLAYDGTTTELKTIFGSDTYPGGWFNYVWDMDAFTTLTLANVQRWGVEAGHASNAKNVVNAWMDVIRYLDGYSMVGGTSGDKVTPFDIAALDKTSAYNVLFKSPNADNVFFGTGTIQLGTGATTHYFEADGDIITFTDLPIASGLYEISGVGSGTDIVIANSLIQSAGTTDATRFAFDMSDSGLGSFAMTLTRLIRAAAITFKSGQTVTDNTFDDCGQITHAGATLNGSAISGYEGTAATAALIYNVNADPDGEMDFMDFTMGTALTHAIELGTNCPASISLRGHSYSGYDTATAGSNLVASSGPNDATIYNNSGKAITINVVGGGGTPSVRNAASSTTTVQNTVNTTIKGVPSGAEWRLYEADATQGIIGSTELDGAESHTGGDITYADEYVSDTSAALQVMADGFIEYLLYFTLGANPQTINVVLTPETNE